MKSAAIGCFVLVLVLTFSIVAYGISAYNGLVGLDEAVDSAWAQVENVYQRRADLIPNLVATVKGAADFEQETLNQVVQARSKVGSINVSGTPTAEQMQAFQHAQGGLSSALSRLLVVVERYPDIKSTENFRDLQAQLEGAENRIAVERMRYNEVERHFNTTRRRFPTTVIASWFGFDEPKPYFESDQGADQAPTVDFP